MGIDIEDKIDRKKEKILFYYKVSEKQSDIKDK